MAHSCRLPAQSCPGSAAHPLTYPHRRCWGRAGLRAPDTGGWWSAGHDEATGPRPVSHLQPAGERAGHWSHVAQRLAVVHVNPPRGGAERGGSSALRLLGQHQGQGSQGPGVTDPGLTGPWAHRTRGSQDPGLTGPGSQDPGVTGPWAHRPRGSQDPGLTGPGVRAAHCLMSALPPWFSRCPRRASGGGLGACPDPPTKYHGRLWAGCQMRLRHLVIHRHFFSIRCVPNIARNTLMPEQHPPFTWGGSLTDAPYFTC